MRDLNGIQFSAYPSNGWTDPAFEAHDPSVEGEDTMVGGMWLHPETGNVENIVVVPSHQRRGIATRLYEMAKLANQVRPDKYPYPEHSQARTKEGNAWAKAVGGRLPQVEECTNCNQLGHLEENCPEGGCVSK